MGSHTIKLTEPGFENFTGRFGSVDFTNGVSDYGVAPNQAESLLNCISGAYVIQPSGDSSLQKDYDTLSQQYENLMAEFQAYKAAHPE